MDFRELCEFFDGSIFYEDFRADLAKSKDRIQQEKESLKPLGLGGNDEARINLIEAVWNLLVGDFKTADKVLTDLQSPKFESRWALRSNLYKGLARAWQRRPPLLAPCSMLGAIGMEIYKARKEFDTTHLEMSRALYDQATELDRLEYLAIGAVINQSLIFYDHAVAINPDLASYDKSSEKTKDQVIRLQAHRRHLQSVRASLVLHDMAPVIGYVDLLLFEILNAQGLTQEAFRQFRSLEESVQSSTDEYRLGMSFMKMGDNLVSAPNTTPLVLSFQIADRFMEFEADSIPYQEKREEWNEVGVSIAMRHLAETFQEQNLTAEAEMSELGSQPKINARYCYRIAKSHFTTARYERGVAACLLREAILMQMEDMEAVQIYNELKHEEEVQSLLELARQKFEEAGDTQAFYLVNVHLMLKNWGTSSEKIYLGRKIGKWAENNDNPVFGYYLAAFALRVGQYQGYQCGALHLAGASYDVARQILKGIFAFRSTWAIVMLAQAQIFTAHGEWKSAKIWNGHVKRSIGIILRQAYGAASDASDGDVLEFVQESQVNFDYLLQKILNSVIDIDSQVGVEVDSETGKPIDFPDSITTFLIEKFFALYVDNPLAKSWLNHWRARVAYFSAIACWTSGIRHGDGDTAKKALQSFLEAHEYQSSWEKRTSDDSGSGRRYWLNKDDGIISLNAPAVAEEEAKKKKFYEEIDIRLLSFLLDIACKLDDSQRMEELVSFIDEDRVVPADYVVISKDLTDLEKYAERRQFEALELMLQCAIKVQNWDAGTYLMECVENISPGYFTSVASFTDYWPWERCLMAGIIYQGQKRYSLAMMYYLQSLDFVMRTSSKLGLADARRSMTDNPNITRLANAFVQICIMWQHQSPRIPSPPEESEITRIDPRLLKVFATQADYSHGDDHAFSALLPLEMLRAQYISEVIDTPAEELEIAEARYQLEVWAALKQKNSLNSEEEEEFNHLDGIKDQLEAQLLQNLDSGIPRSSWALSDSKLREMVASIPTKCLVIYTALSVDGLALFALDNTGVKVSLFNDSATSPRITKLVMEYLHVMVNAKGANDPMELHDTSLILSSLLLSPVKQHVEDKDHIIFVPSGILSRLPFGALIYLRKHLILQKAVSQVPSLSALYQLLNRRTSAEKKDKTITIIARPGSAAESRRGGPEALPFAGIEAVMIGAHYRTEPLNATDVTRQDFRSHLRKSQIVHIGTHGDIDEGSPSSSHISLKNPFRILDLSNLKTSISLVIFSACLTGVGDARDGGDMLGFSHAMLAAGADCYLGALWKADDVATMLQMFFFHMKMLTNDASDAKSLAWIWHDVTCMLYETTRQELLEMLGMCLKVWDKSEEIGNHPGEFVRAGRRKLEVMIEKLTPPQGEGLYNFKHPYFWAPFIMVGNARLVMVCEQYSEVAKKVKNWRAESARDKSEA